MSNNMAHPAGRTSAIGSDRAGFARIGRRRGSVAMGRCLPDTLRTLLGQLRRNQHRFSGLNPPLQCVTGLPDISAPQSLQVGLSGFAVTVTRLGRSSSTFGFSGTEVCSPSIR